MRDHAEEIRSRFGVEDLAVFGSVARNETTETSDVDILVRLKGRATFDGFMDLKFFLEDLLGVRVDLVTDKALRSELRPRIEKEAVRVA
jgi:predicted nucleotidyltransferase